MTTDSRRQSRQRTRERGRIERRRPGIACSSRAALAMRDPHHTLHLHDATVGTAATLPTRQQGPWGNGATRISSSQATLRFATKSASTDTCPRRRLEGRPRRSALLNALGTIVEAGTAVVVAVSSVRASRIAPHAGSKRDACAIDGAEQIGLREIYVLKEPAAAALAASRRRAVRSRLGEVCAGQVGSIELVCREVQSREIRSSKIRVVEL